MIVDIYRIMREMFRSLPAEKASKSDSIEVMVNYDYILSY
jgi:hypothetical protein